MFIFIDDDGSWHMLVCAQDATGSRFRRGCIAHATSSDGESWELQEPLYAPRHLDDLEVPALIKENGKYYLFLKEFRGPRTYVRMAESLKGPWLAADYDEFTPPHNGVTRFCRFQDKLLCYTWFRTSADWARTGSAYSCVLPPREVKFGEDGFPYLASFSGWEERATGPMETLDAAALMDFVDGPGTATVEGERVALSAIGQETVAAACDYDNFILEGEVEVADAPAAGFVFRLSENTEDGVHVRLDFVRKRAELWKVGGMDSDYKRYVRIQPGCLQTWDAPTLERGRPVSVRIVAANEYLEVSVDGRVCLTTISWAYRAGRVGAFVENGSASLSPIRITPIRPSVSGG
ncbi:MAG: hypothetical protein ACYTGH_18840 [Planctomycetota bacterium]|jgi:beta-fructofuranosidase